MLRVLGEAQQSSLGIQISRIETRRKGRMLEGNRTRRGRGWDRGSNVSFSEKNNQSVLPGSLLDTD